MTNIKIPKSETHYATPLVSSVLFPLLYATLGLQRYAPRTTRKIWPKYDYIIVGSGAGGSTLAARLSEKPCVNVLLLEAGKLPPRVSEIPFLDTALVSAGLDWNYLSTPQKHTGRLMTNHQIPLILGKAVGGSTIINAMLYVRGSRFIYNKWAQAGAVGWSYKNILPYFKKMESNRNPEAVDTFYHGFRGPVTVETPIFPSIYKSAIENAIQELGHYVVDANGANQKGFYNFQTNSRYGQRCSVAKAYLVPAENRTNLHIVEDAFVTKVLIDGNRAYGVEFRNNNRSFKIFASREVILSAGAANTPKLLMLSGIGPKEHLHNIGIPVVASLPVGRNLHDHQAVIQLYNTNKFPSVISIVKDPATIKEYIEKRTGILSAPAAGLYLGFLTNDQWTSKTTIPNYVIAFAHISPELLGMHQEIFKQYENSSQIACVSMILQPKSSGTVKLSSADPYEDPLIDPNYFAKSEDFISVIQGLKECDRFMNSQAFKPLSFKPIDIPLPGCENFSKPNNEYYKCLSQSAIVSTYHFTGTCKMGNPHDDTTVVDPELRVKGIQNLRVVDASVMPIIPTANTMIPTIMIAEKAADIIKGTIPCRDEYDPWIYNINYNGL